MAKVSICGIVIWYMYNMCTYVYHMYACTYPNICGFEKSPHYCVLLNN